jgi:hypothetical protein
LNLTENFLNGVRKCPPDFTPGGISIAPTHLGAFCTFSNLSVMDAKFTHMILNSMKTGSDW